MTIASKDLDFNAVPSVVDIESITSRSTYHPSLYFAPKHPHRKFQSIVAPYHLKGAMIQCGIADCRQLHLHGYIISTTDKLETNIGKDCGRKHFEADFTTEMKRHDQLYERRLKVGRIVALKATAPDFLKRILDLQEEYSFLKSLRYKLRGALSSTDNQRIEHKVKTGDANLYRYEVRNKEEREVYFETNPAARKTGSVPPKEIKIGEIVGFRFLGATHKDEEIFNFIEPLKRVIAASEEEIMLWRRGEIAKVHSWIGGAEKAAALVADLIESGNLFFTTQNVPKLASIGVAPDALELANAEIVRVMNIARKRPNHN